MGVPPTVSLSSRYLLAIFSLSCGPSEPRVREIVIRRSPGKPGSGVAIFAYHEAQARRDRRGVRHHGHMRAGGRAWVTRQAPAGALHQPAHVAPPLGRGRTRAIASQHIDGALPAADLRATAAVPLD